MVDNADLYEVSYSTALRLTYKEYIRFFWAKAVLPLLSISIAFRKRDALAYFLFLKSLSAVASICLTTLV